MDIFVSLHGGAAARFGIPPLSPRTIFVLQHWCAGGIDAAVLVCLFVSNNTNHRIMVLITPAPEEAGDRSSPDKKKKSKLTTRQDAARRLIEYCVVVSSVRKQQQRPDEETHEPTLDSSTDWGEEDVVYDDYEFQPVITARYPLEDHADNPLHESTTFFCHPSGISLRSEPSMPKVRVLFLFL